MIGIGFEFSRGEIEDLAQKLGSLSPQLTEGERALLLAIFYAAGDSVSVIPPKIAPGSEYTGADLKEKILKAFIPAEDNGDDNFILQLQATQERISPPLPIRPPPITPGPTPTPTPNPPSPTTPS